MNNYNRSNKNNNKNNILIANARQNYICNNHHIYKIFFNFSLKYKQKKTAVKIIQVSSARDKTRSSQNILYMTIDRGHVPDLIVTCYKDTAYLAIRFDKEKINSPIGLSKQ